MSKTVLVYNNRKLYIDKKSDINLSFFQNILDEAYRTKHKIICTCNDIPMSVRRYSKHYSIASYPNRLSEHAAECVFSDKSDYITEDGIYRLSSVNVFLSDFSHLVNTKFKEDGEDRYDLSRWMRNDEINKVLDNDEYRKCYNNFNSLINDIIDDTYIRTFNYLNSKIERVDSFLLRMPSSSHVIINILKTLQEKVILPNMLDVKNYLSNNDVNIYVGIITDFKIKEEYVQCYTKKHVFYVPHVVWASSIRKLVVKNQKHTIHPPYLYVSVSKKGKIVRLWLRALTDDSFFIPVDSNLERSIFLEWIKDKFVFFKPLFSNSYLTILKTPYKELQPLFFVGAKPDAVLFSNKEITFVEIVDRRVLESDDIYRKRLEEKEIAYHKLSPPFTYKRLVI